MFADSTLIRSGRALAIGALAASLALAGTAGAQEGPRIVTPDLFDALESWGESTVSVETIALDENPNAIREYGMTVSSSYGGKTLSQHFAQAYPEAVEEYLESRELEVIEDEDDFTAFALTYEETYERWQSEPELAENTFDRFIDTRYPEIRQQADFEAITPAKSGITIRQHLFDIQRTDLVEELDIILGTVDKGDPKTPCICWTVATFPHQPDPWQAESPDTYNNSWGWPVKKRQEHSLYTQGRGGAKHFDFYRKSNHTVYEVSRNRTNYDAQMRVRMLCTQNGQEGGTNCEGSTCTGELAMRTAYASRVYESVDVGGIWSKRSRMRVGDAAALLFDPPGPAPQQKLFEKGVAVAGDYKTSWNAEAGLTLLQTVATVAVTVATNGTTAASLLEGNLLDDTYNAIIGLIKKEGSTGSKQVDMQIAFDTAGSAPFILVPNQTLAFDLDTVSDIYSRGYGGESKGWGDIWSSFYMTGVARNYQCAAGVQAPTPQAFWLWSAASNAPQSPTTVQNLVRNWITVEYGAAPSGTSANVGQYP